MPKQLTDLEKIEGLDAAQKLKKKWVADGDENSNFFHSMLKRKRRKLAISGLLVDGSWVVDLVNIKDQFLRFYKEKSKVFSGVFSPHPNSRIKQLSSGFKEMLVARFTEDEIRAAIWTCGSDKAPGPDGFSFRFIKKFWDLMKIDICNFVDEFFDSSMIPNGCNSSFSL